MKYGLIGEKLGHSFSKEIHAEIGMYDYELKEIPREKIKEFFEEKDFLGINVTIPYKEEVIPFLDWISEDAKKIGAVNTIVNRNGKLYGYNTDYYGAKNLIIKTGVEINNKKVLILGTGGTSKTLFSVVKDLGAREIIKVSRSGKDNCVKYDEAVKLHGDAEVIVNTTPSGMYPNGDSVPIDINAFVKTEGVIDVIYNPLNTRLVLQAKEKNIKASGGLYMLVGQAVKAAEHFMNVEIDKESITNNIYEKIISRKRNVVLIGMPGSGKSTVGKIIAGKTGKTFIDTDELIERETGLSPGQIITGYGEQYFRNIEKETVKKAAQGNGAVIATGGGIVKDGENISELKKNGVICFIDRDIGLLAMTPDRPLSSDIVKLKKIFNERYDKYLSGADFTVKSDSTAEDVADRIIGLLKNVGKERGVYMKILIINGPNLNMLGIREPSIYGENTYADLIEYIKEFANGNGVEAEFFQSNHEGAIVDEIQKAYYDKTDGIVINPAAYTHTSVAIADAIKAVNIPTVEVHISDVDSREDFRKISYVKNVAIATVKGKGFAGYTEAIGLIKDYLKRK